MTQNHSSLVLAVTRKELALVHSQRNDLKDKVEELLNEIDILNGVIAVLSNQLRSSDPQGVGPSDPLK